LTKTTSTKGRREKERLDDEVAAKLQTLLVSFPYYKRVIQLAIAHEEEGFSRPNYRGWQWQDVEVHPTKLIRLVTERISRINLRTRQATFYVLKDREKVKLALKELAPLVKDEEFEEAYFTSSIKGKNQRDSPQGAAFRNNRSERHE
jgi:hypothetical protein